MRVLKNYGNKCCVWYQNRSLGRWSMNYVQGHARGTTLRTGGVLESQVSILWNYGLWAHHVVKSRKGRDVLRDHASKACQRVACRLCRQQLRYQGWGTKRTILLLVETRRTNRQSSRPSVVTEMLSTIVTGSYWQGCTTRCLPKQGIITSQLSQITRKV